MLSLQRDAAGGVAFLLVYDFSVDLRCGDVFVGEHLRYGVDIGAVGYQQGYIGVAQAVQGDFLEDTCGFQPALKWLAYGRGSTL